MSDNYPAGVTDGHEHFHTPDAHEVRRDVADDWLRGLKWNARPFQAYIEWCYEKFPGQMALMAQAFAEADGYEAYQEYCDSFNDKDPGKEEE